MFQKTHLALSIIASLVLCVTQANAELLSKSPEVNSVSTNLNAHGTSISKITTITTKDMATEVKMITNGLLRVPKAKKLNEHQIALTFDGVLSNLTEDEVFVNTPQLKSLIIKKNNGDAQLILNTQDYENITTKVEGGALFLRFYPTDLQKKTSLIEPVNNFITQMDLLHKIGESQIIVDLLKDNAVVDVKQLKNRIIVNLKGEQFSPNLIKSITPNDSRSLVKTAKIYNKDGSGWLELFMAGSYDYTVYQLNKQLSINIKEKKDDLAGKLKPSTSSTPSAYSGKKLSLDIQNADVRRILQLLATYTDQNIVASDTVTGLISLKLQDVPWDEALNAIMRSKGLVQRKTGKTIFVAPVSEVTKYEEAEATAYNQSVSLAQLETVFIQLNYAKASDVADMLKQSNDGNTEVKALNRIKAGMADENANMLLSSRGTVTVDNRTNTIAVSDTEQKLKIIKKLINQVDVPVRQVMVEARIVRASTKFSKSIGVKWGVLKNTGMTVASDMKSLTAQYNNRYSGAGGNSIDSNVNLDLGQTLGATSSLALGLINTSNALLSLELSALQSDGLGEVLSTPKIMTGDKQEAVIRSGVKLPYQTSSENGGTNTTFQDAVLELSVTPSITPDGTVQMKLNISQDAQGGITNAGYAIDTNSLHTNVLVNNGETVVLGGLFEETKNNTVNKVPVLGDMPYMGNLFKNNTKTNNKQELLVFITPKIIDNTSKTGNNSLAKGDKLISIIE